MTANESGGPRSEPVDCGAQRRLPGSRRAVGRGIAAQETFRQKRVERFDADYLCKVREHSAGRNRAVAHLLALLSFLRNLGNIPGGAKVEWDRAHVQAIKGDRYADAAHNLPCQILIGEHFPWELAVHPDVHSSLMVAELRGLFGAVYVAPKVFNAADSIAEANCLRGALIKASEAVIARSAPIGREAGVLKRGVGLEYGEIQRTTADVSAPAAGTDRAAVAAGYAVWVTQSKAAFASAMAAVSADGASSMGNDVTDDVLYILERYSRFADEAPMDFAGIALARLEERMRR